MARRGTNVASAELGSEAAGPLTSEPGSWRELPLLCARAQLAARDPRSFQAPGPAASALPQLGERGAPQPGESRVGSLDRGSGLRGNRARGWLPRAPQRRPLSRRPGKSRGERRQPLRCVSEATAGHAGRSPRAPWVSEKQGPRVLRQAAPPSHLSPATRAGVIATLPSTTALGSPPRGPNSGRSEIPQGQGPQWANTGAARWAGLPRRQLGSPRATWYLPEGPGRPGLRG